ncbi:transcription initiation protein [Ornithinimicrobium ciconiae]|uniref:Transcription initiation protein n=1 Tax=Ornithinimicrobium ciconiae TaxID=2594265 RepID=A0A516G868_9MICO|nr:YciI family protein [Ornithinimicrobium ciconiae]QDO87695.1 transcription initiation protein [Ornithinimicrobium ciconiae]
MTEYMVVIVGDADRWWSTMSRQERADGYAEYTRFGEELTRRGHRITGGAELHPTTEARTVQPGGQVVTEGPFAETAEHVGGFYLVETDDLDDLTECAKIIAALGDGVEIRRTVAPEERAASAQESAS